MTGPRRLLARRRHRTRAFEALARRGALEPDQGISDVGGGKLIAAVKDADGNVIGLLQST